MVKRKYFCYLCQKEFNHMVSAMETLNCQQCHQGFVELIEKQAPSLDEEKQRVNEQYRISHAEQIHGNVVDLYDRSTANLFGEPDESRLRHLHAHEEERLRQEERQR